MKLNLLRYFTGLLVALNLASCGFFAQQLTDKAQEDRLLKPGALDTGIAKNFNEYHFRFLDRYRVRHQWPVTSACKYAQYGTKYKMGETNYGDVNIVDDIYEDGSGVWQRGNPRQGFGSYVKSVIRHQPIYGTQGLERYEDQEQGLQPVCFEAWVGTSHTLIMRVHKRDVVTWRSLWTTYNPSGKWSEKQIGMNRWWVLENAESDLASSGTGGWFLSYMTPIGDTGYTMAVQLGATKQSLQNPQAHAAFQVMFRHLIESVKIEPLTPAIEAEMAQLKVQAEEIVRQDCIGIAKRTKPPVWCQKYLGQ